MSSVAACLSDISRPFAARCEGRLVDVNTGRLRRGHVLVQRTPGIELFIGLGGSAAQAMDFVFDDARSGDFAAAEQRSQIDPLDAIKDRHLRRLALLEILLEKAAVDDPVHPGYPAGAPGDEGGQFRPKDSSADAKETTEQKIKRLDARRKFRILSIAALRAGATIALNGVPGVGEAADIEELASLAQTAIELGNEASSVHSALDFVRNGPYAESDLRASLDDEEFSSFDAFKKLSPAIEALLKRFGSAGSGNDWHHIVEQGGVNTKNIPPELLHSTRNVWKVPELLHEVVNGEYSKQSKEDPSKTVRAWLRTKSFDEQYEYGIKTLKDLGILKK
ncbi:MAG TPA: hypothetical protein VJR47_13040 [Stellaceae bacterium]|nr:hypothetical protein [Stellaceae bacterium]